MRLPLVRLPRNPVLSMVLSSVVRRRLPGRPSPENIRGYLRVAAKQDGDMAGLAMVLVQTDLTITDYKLWQTAHLRASGKELFLLAEPLTGRWHAYPKWMHLTMAALKILIDTTVVEYRKRSQPSNAASLDDGSQQTARIGTWSKGSRESRPWD